MKNPSLTDLKPFQAVAKDLLAELLARGSKPELPIETMPGLNYKLWGIHKRKMLVVGARTSNGKSMFVLNLAYDLAMQGKRVLFLSLEMPKERILERIFCLDQKVHNMDLLKNGYNKDKEIRDKYDTFCNNNMKSKLIISDCIGKDWAFVDKVVENLTLKPDIIFLDHIQEIRGGKSQKDMIDEHISKMRESAIRNNYALVVCSQVNRVSSADREDKEPQLHHLKATGFLEESADQVILLHWPWHYDNSKSENEFILNVAKNRDGMTGRVKMYYKPKYYMLRDFVDEKTKYKAVMGQE